jgi:catechol-2,3-dioxygenase
MATVQRLNHAVLYVGDAERSAAFYCDSLGFEVVAAFPGAAFLRAAGSPNDHDLGLFSVGPDARRPAGPAIGLYHLAWQVDTIDDLAALRARLLEVGALVGESDHHVSKSLYAVDPDGNEFEVMWAVPRHAWTGKVGTVRLDLAGELAQWSGVRTGTQANIPA